VELESKRYTEDEVASDGLRATPAERPSEVSPQGHRLVMGFRER